MSSMNDDQLKASGKYASWYSPKNDDSDSDSASTIPQSSPTSPTLITSNHGQTHATTVPQTIERLSISTQIQPANASSGAISPVDSRPKLSPPSRPPPRAVEHSAVSLAFLQRFATSVEPQLTTGEVVFKYIIPATISSECRFTDQLPATHIGKPTYFVSHRWADNFHRLVRMIEKHIKSAHDTATDPSTIFLWLDIFGVNQHPGAAQLQDLDHLSGAINSSENGTLLVMDDEGKVLSRIWCLFEIHTTVRQRKAHLRVLMPQTVNYDQMEQMWTDIDVFKAEATIESDRTKIIKQFEQSNLDARALTMSLKASIVESSELRVEEQRKQGNQHALLETLETCAQLKQLAGLLDAALPLMEEAEKIGLGLPNRGKEDIAMSSNNMGSLLQAMGKYEEALPYFEKDLAISREVLGENHPDVATSYDNMGSLLHSLGKFEKALPHFEKSLAIRRKVFGEDHPDVATSSNNMGELLQAIGRSDEALQYHEKSLAISRQVFGEDHPDVATSSNNIGSLLQAVGRLEDALPYHEKSLAIRRKVFGENHPKVAIGYNGMGSLLEDMGKFDEALPYFEKSLSILRKVLGEEHPNVATSYNNMGSLLQAMDKYEEALPYLEKSLAIFRKVFGENHPDIATSSNNLGSLLKDMGRLEAALPYLEKSLAIRRQVLGEEHPDVATSYNSLDELFQALGKPEQTASSVKERLPSNEV